MEDESSGSVPVAVHAADEPAGNMPGCWQVHRDAGTEMRLLAWELPCWVIEIHSIVGLKPVLAAVAEVGSSLVVGEADIDVADEADVSLDERQQKPASCIRLVGVGKRMAVDILGVLLRKQLRHDEQRGGTAGDKRECGHSGEVLRKQVLLEAAAKIGLHATLAVGAVDVERNCRREDSDNQKELDSVPAASSWGHLSAGRRDQG